MVKVSVIVPVYNTEKYLKECLNSIVNQTLKDIEIICINDGSTDNSLEILKEYEKHDTRITVLSQENSGQSVARNKGIIESHGEYIYFMDSDDYLELNALREIYSISKKNNLDILIFKLINFVDSSYEKYTTDYYEMDFLKPMRNKIFNFTDFNESILDICVSPPGKLFKKDLISQIRFIEGLIFEDNLFFAEAMLHAKRVLFYDKYFYNRRIRDDSTTANNNLKFADSIIIINHLIDLAKKFNIYEEYKFGLAKKKIDLANFRYSLVKEEFKEKFFNLVKNDFKNFQDEYENNILEQIDSWYSYTFKNFINSNNHKEYDLNLEIYNLKKDIKKVKKEKKILKKRIKKLNTKNELILKSNSWKITKPLRYLKKYLGNRLFFMVKISVIIPVFNVEDYLEECLDSILNQTLKDIEIICINDGSMDNSLHILEKYAKKDNRIKIFNQINSGQGKARNKGIFHSTGEFIYFVDADDYIKSNMLEELYENAISNNSDIVMSKIARFNNDSDEIDYNHPGFDFDNQFENVDFNKFTFNYKDIKKYVLNASFAPWMKLFKSAFLKDNGFFFTENIAYEDVPFHVETILKAKKISFSPNFYYFYRNNPNSTINTSKNGFDIFKIIDIIEKYLIENDYFEEFEEEFCLFKITQINNYLLSTMSNDYFIKAKEEFLKINCPAESELISDFLYERYNLVLSSDSLIDYCIKHYELMLRDKDNEIDYLIKQNNKLFKKNKKLKKKLKN